MMARKKGWASVIIRLFFIVTLSLSWNHLNALAQRDAGSRSNAFKGSSSVQFEASILVQLPKDILSAVFEARHLPQIKKVLERGNKALTINEQLLKQYFENPKLKPGGELTNLEVRQRLIHEMRTTQKGFQTIAIGVDPKSKTVAVAGNIKELDIDDIKVRSNQLFPKVKTVGLQQSDFGVIKDIVQKAIPGYAIEVISPSDKDLERVVGLEVQRHSGYANSKEGKTGNRNRGQPADAHKVPEHDILNAKAHFYHAEMQIKKFFVDLSDGTKIVASKQYCVNCDANLPNNVKEQIEGKAYASLRMRWAEPESVKRDHIADASIPTKAGSESFEEQRRREAIDRITEAGASCSTVGGHRRRRSLCNRFEDVTEVNADTFRKKLADLPEGERKHLLYALDQVGTHKLKGSELAWKDIQNQWKKWKSSVVKGTVDALSKGTIISHLTGVKYTELSKIGVSPKVLAQSLDLMHKKKLEEYEKAKNIDADSLKGFQLSYKFVKGVNLGMVGKNLIGGVLNGDVESLITLGGLLGADQILTKAGEKISATGVKLAQAGNKVTGAVLKATGPIVGAATGAFSIYSLVGQVNQIGSLKKICQEKDNTFQERFEKDCKFDMDVAIANAVADVVGIVSTVATTVSTILALFSISTGPLGIIAAAIDVLVAIGTQIYAAARTVAKISSSLVGGLTGKEKFETGLRAFFGMKPPKNIQALLSLKLSFNSIVAQAEAILKSSKNFQTYVLPTNYTRKINCNKKGKNCDLKQEVDSHSRADFQSRRWFDRPRVEPDNPSWGRLECKPSPTLWSNPSSGVRTYDYLCYNLIAVSAPGRQNLPALIDLKDGTDYFLGFPHRKHVFLVGAGWKTFTGGSADDIFILTFFPFCGKLDGAGGKNTLVLDVNGKRSSPILWFTFPPVVSMQRETIDLSSCQRFSGCECSFENLHQIIGRSKKPDTLVTNCAVTYVDLNGGKSETEQDHIQTSNSYCKAEVTFQLRSFTKLDNYHKANGKFNYQVEYAEGIQVNLDPQKNVHRFIFTNDIIRANFTYIFGRLLITNTKEKKAFNCNYIKSTTSDFLLMNQAGLSIQFDQNSNSFYGLIPPSSSDKQEVNGLLNYPNRFFISTNASLKLIGGNKDDIFSLTGVVQPTGSLDGKTGFDSIIIQKDFQPNATIHIDLKSKVLSPGNLKISNIETIIGRPALSEVVNGSCEVNYLDLQGGNDNGSDVVRLSSVLLCKSQMTFVVRNFTKIENYARSGDFSYQIQVDSSKSQTNFIKVEMLSGNASHRYTFFRSPSSVNKITFNRNSKQLGIRFENGTWSGKINLQRSTINIGDELLVQVFPQVYGIVRVNSSKSPRNITGLQNYPNIFVLDMNTSNSNFIGGGKDDTFFITSEDSNGKVDGGNGSNSLFLVDSLWEDKLVIIDVVNDSFAVKNGSNTEYQSEFSNIQRFYGRKGQTDIILPGCYTELVDTKGGQNGYDLIYISSIPDCYFVLDVAIRPKLIVFNDATEGQFKYEGDFQDRGGSTSIFLTFTPYTDHKVYLDIEFSQLINLNLDEGRVNMTATDKSEFSVDYLFTEEADFHTSPSISFRDGLELKISQRGPLSSTIFGTLRNLSQSDMEDLEENIQHTEFFQRYRTAAKNTMTSVILQVGNDTLMSIGSGGSLDILTAVPGYSNNVLVCNGANQTIYRIANGSAIVEIIFDLKSPGNKMLDLTPIVKDDSEITPTLEVMNGKDLKVQIKDVEITIKGLANPSYEFLTSWQVLLREQFLNIENEDSESFKLVPQPIVMDPKTYDHFIVHTTSLEHNTRIFTVSDNHSSPIKYERVKQGNSLMFTNLFQQDLSEEVASVVFYDFYDEQEPEALYEKNIMFEVEAGVMVNISLETGENLPTFEQREREVFGQVDPLFYIVPIIATIVIGSIAWLCWSKKCYNRNRSSLGMNEVDKGKIRKPMTGM